MYMLTDILQLLNDNLKNGKATTSPSQSAVETLTKIDSIEMFDEIESSLFNTNKYSSLVTFLKNFSV